MTYDEMVAFLDDAGYNIADMHSDEIDELAAAEGYVFNDDKDLYEEVTA